MCRGRGICCVMETRLNTTTYYLSFSFQGVDACQYDSGGALSCHHNGRYYLQGLVSWGYQCALPNKYGVYANLPLLKQWVVQTILSYDPNNVGFANDVIRMMNTKTKNDLPSVDNNA